MAVKPVIIPLVADTTGLQPGIDALEEMGKVDKDTAAKFREANKAFQERGKVLDQAVGSADKLTAASKKLVEAIAGGAIAQAAENIKKIKDQTESTNAEFIVLTKTITLAKQELAKLAQGTPAFNKLSKEIQAAEMAMGNFEKEATSSRAQLKQYREALLQLEDAGLEGTKVFQDMAVAAGQLQDQIGDTQARIKALSSDTFALDVGIQAIQGLAGAFSVAQGAAALFGDENEDVQKALLKVNAAMSILNGLQQIQNILEKQSAVSIAATIALDKIKVAQIYLATAAESRNIVVRYAAIAAQTALNAVMAANPAGILLTAIAALAGVMLYLTSNTDDAADAQERLKYQMDLATESAKNQAEFVEILANGYQTEIDLLRARGATRSQVAAAEAEAIKKQLADQRELQKSLISNGGQEDEYAKSVAKSSALRGQLRVKEVELQKALFDEAKEEGKKAADENKKNLDAFLRDQVAANEAAVLEARNGFERLFAQIQLINAKLRQELANPNLGPNERVAAELRAGEEIRKARQDLLGDLVSLERDHNAQIAKADNDRILQGAALAQQELERKRQNAEDQKKITEDRIKREQELEQRRVEFSLQTASSIAQSITDIYKNNADAQIAIEQQRLEQGLITQEQFDQRSRSIRRRAAQQEKQLAMFQAGIALSLAILSIMKDQTIPAPAKPLFIALASAAALAQIAAIQSKPIPAFKKGTKNAPGGLSLIGEAGPELYHANGKWGYASQATLLNLPKGAKVIPTLETEKILQKYNIPVPNAQQNVNTTYGGVKIDYNKLGSVIGKQISKLPLQVNQWDENGYSRHQTSISSRAAHLKTKFSSKGK